MKRAIILLSITLLVAINFAHSNAQVKVHLRFDESAKSTAANSLFCDKDYNCGLYQNEQSKTSKFGKDVHIEVRRTGKNFYLLIDTNQNKKLTDEKKVLLENGSKVNVKIEKKLKTGKTLFLPFEISHQTREKDGSLVDKFSIIPHYIGAGTFRYKNCSSKIGLSDLNLDGGFDLSDSERGTNFHIDRNNDGKFWGKEEHRRANEIIDFCGQNFLVSSLNDAVLRLTPTSLQLARVGEVVPKFSFALPSGEITSSDKLKGKHYVLDFWASWCAPCVKNLPQINSLKNDYADRVSVFSVNVDEAGRRNSAQKIIDENQMSDFSVIRGLGDADPLWKTFGGANLNRLSIPLYVLIDKKGVVRYAGAGGENLAELKESVEKLFAN